MCVVPHVWSDAAQQGVAGTGQIHDVPRKNQFQLLKRGKQVRKEMDLTE